MNGFTFVGATGVNGMLDNVVTDAGAPGRMFMQPSMGRVGTKGFALMVTPEQNWEMVSSLGPICAEADCG